jgi:hypothetical protein
VKAAFKQHRANDVYIELIPETREEQLLIALWLRFDSNYFSATVERAIDDEAVLSVELHASDLS